MYDLIQANLESNSDAWYTRVPKDLKLLLISGEEDPVGDYGEGVRTVAENLEFR